MTPSLNSSLRSIVAGSSAGARVRSRTETHAIFLTISGRQLLEDPERHRKDLLAIDGFGAKAFHELLKIVSEVDTASGDKALAVGDPVVLPCNSIDTMTVADLIRREGSDDLRSILKKAPAPFHSPLSNALLDIEGYVDRTIDQIRRPRIRLELTALLDWHAPKDIDDPHFLLDRVTEAGLVRSKVSKTISTLAQASVQEAFFAAIVALIARREHRDVEEKVDVLRRVRGLSGRPPETLSMIAEDIGVSCARVSGIEREVLSLMRRVGVREQVLKLHDSVAPALVSAKREKRLPPLGQLIIKIVGS